MRTTVTLLPQNQVEWKRLSLVASLNENGVLFTDPSGAIIWANDGFSKLTGYSTEEAIGQTPIQLCKGSLSDKAVLKEMVAAFTAGKTFSIEVVHYRKDGSYFWGRVKGQPVPDDTGSIVQYFAVVEDVTVKKHAEELLKKNEEKYRGIISNMNLGLMEVDLDSRIQFVNQSFCEMTGYSWVELQGRNAVQLFMKEPDRALMAGKDQMRLQGISDAYEMEFTTRKGEQRWWLISGAPRYNDEGTITGSVGIHLDITEQKKNQQELIDARRQAESSAQSKEAFLANMSHEIRTPMNAILGMGRQLKKTQLDAQQQSFLDTMNAAAENLLVIINDILDTSKIEAGKLVLEQIGFRMSDLLLRASRVMMHKAEEKGLQCSFLIEEGVPAVLLGDPYRLNQVILNLVSNAIKFTEQGEVTIRCFTHPVADGGFAVGLEVKDTGIGMDTAFLQQLFQKFQQEDVSVARKYGGTGLGMSISKQLVEMMGGTIEVNSEKDKGTTVTLLLPLLPGTEADVPVKKEAGVNMQALKQKKILLVDDNEMNRAVATAVLNNYGAIVSEVADGLEAVKAVGNACYDLVLMDVQMPVMDGFEATRTIRRSGFHRLPIVALTANAIKGEYEKCLAAGMNGYVSKPFEEEELIKTLGHLLERPLSPDATDAAANKLYSLEKLQELSQGDTAFLQKMLQLFLAEVPAAVHNIRQAYGAHDLKQVQAMAHRIKPSLDHLCIGSLRCEIRELEQMAKEGRNGVRMDALIRQVETVIERVTADITVSLPY